ncbi:hypothetical protein HNQ91_001925 [Filimonas zeae]|uniref:Uncharacterized protein n=1 Tax=Filimonas zeae TaxID=1737353 RepID=A0A917IWK6_9BACT|nr:hypothetical protein [Filimonas zeae]MDR6338874.1 hypothetical protein [Filimonas zeae]GGH66177.1 hypothetical protein GCM10011379_20090 [Filimonas zeae]
MKKDIELINIEFNTLAQRHYFSVCDRLEKASAGFSHWQHETEYLQMHAMYWDLLRINLETEALTLIEQHKNAQDIHLLQKALTIHINRYLNEFKVKYRLI